MIPLMAIQMSALRLNNNLGLMFTTVISQLSLGLVDEDEETLEVTDRAYWENRETKRTVAMADEFLEIARELDSSLELKYNKFYIGLARNGHPSNFIIVRPKKGFIRFEPRLKNSLETQERLENAGLDVMDYDTRWGRYRIRLKPGEIEKNKIIIKQVMKEAYGETADE